MSELGNGCDHDHDCMSHRCGCITAECHGRREACVNSNRHNRYSPCSVCNFRGVI